MQFSSTLRTNRGTQIGTTLGAGGTLTFRTGAAPGVGNADTGTPLTTLTAVVYSESAGVCTITATADPGAAANGTPGHGRLLTSGAVAHIEGTAGVGSPATLGTVTLTGGAIATVPVSAGGTGYPASSTIAIKIGRAHV